jgi:hypothetical protein
MRSTFPSHSELMFIVPVTETEICHLALLAYNFRHFAGPTEVLLSRLAFLLLKAPLTAPQ